MRVELSALSARERRLVALLILSIVVVLGLFGVVAPMADGAAGRAAERARLTRQFVTNARLIASVPRLRQIAETQRRDDPRFAIIAADQLTANEALRERIADAVARAGGQVRTTQDVETGTGWAQAWAEARLTMPQLVSLLSDVQNQRPYLAIMSLSVSADRGALSGKTDLLDIRLEAAVRHHPA